jgi:hypothetical protein
VKYGYRWVDVGKLALGHPLMALPTTQSNHEKSNDVPQSRLEPFNICDLEKREIAFL